MNKIEVRVLDCHNDPTRVMAALAKLTQRGHSISTMDDLEKLFNAPASDNLVKALVGMPHGTIKRFCPITIAIVGASRRFLAQARTHQVGINYVSASLQYSDYSGKGQFVVPYQIIEHDKLAPSDEIKEKFLYACDDAMNIYEQIAGTLDNDTAGYVAPQSLRNILIMQANHESWMTFINRRSCNRNTDETQYVTLRIWEELLKTPGGEEMFKYAGPDCMFGRCREGRLSCGEPIKNKGPREIIDMMWPLLKEDK